MGKGVEKNVFTACGDCHREYDLQPQNDTGQTYKWLMAYFKGKYPDWDMKDVIYTKKEGDRY